MRQPSGRTHLWVLVADPVAHVRAPSFVNPMFEARGLDGFLMPLHVRVADLADVLPRLAKIGNLKGVIVTIPHKEAIARLCDALGPNATEVGAVNTIRIEADGSLTGEMFDGLGLIETAKRNGMDPAGRRVLLLGAGGAARAIAFAMLKAGARRIGIANRTRERAAALVAEMPASVASVVDWQRAGDVSARSHGTLGGSATPLDVDLVVNCTSLGLKPTDPMPIDPRSLPASCDLIDIIAVRETELMAAAAARGCRVVGGRPMIELQFDAQLGFIGAPPPLEKD